MSFTSAPRMERPWKYFRARQRRLRAAEAHEPAREFEESYAAPAIRLQHVQLSLVVLAVGVVVALLRAPELVAAADHRHADRQQQRRHEVALLLLAQLDDVRVVVGPSTPQFQLRLSFSPSRLSSPLASLCFWL